MIMSKKLIVAGLLSIGCWFGMQAMQDNGNKILNDVKQRLQDDDNKKFDEFCEMLPSRLTNVFGNKDTGAKEFSHFIQEYFGFIDYVNNPYVGAPNTSFETNCKRLARVFAGAGMPLVRQVREDAFDYEEFEAPRNRRSVPTLIRRLLLPGLALGTVLVAGLVAVFLLKGDTKKKTIPAVH
jgi:hypothetical protein